MNEKGIFAFTSSGNTQGCATPGGFDFTAVRIDFLNEVPAGLHEVSTGENIQKLTAAALSASGQPVPNNPACRSASALILSEREVDEVAPENRTVFFATIAQMTGQAILTESENAELTCVFQGKDTRINIGDIHRTMAASASSASNDGQKVSQSGTPYDDSDAQAAMRPAAASEGPITRLHEKLQNDKQPREAATSRA